VRWSSPQQLSVLSHGTVASYSSGNIKDNLYSLGIVIWELLTYCQQPFTSLFDQEIVNLKISGKSQMYKYFKADLDDADIQSKYISLVAAQNLHTDPEKRLPASKFEEKLSLITVADKMQMESLYTQLQQESSLEIND